MRRVLLVLVAALLAVAAPALPADATPGPPDAPQYWFDDWRVEQLWGDGIRGQGVTIAEIDTGVNASLPALRGRILKGVDLGRSGDGRIDREVDSFGHGTAMASIMVGRPSLFGIAGIAPDARILPIAVPLEGTSDSDQPDDLPRAIRYAADHGAKIISMSLGGKRTPRTDDAPCPADEQAAVFHALRKGALVVASVGNTGPTRNTIEEPGVCLGVVSVGSVDANHTVAPFSARQPYLTMVAPGVAIPSLGRIPGQAYSGKGTSQSTALVSAALALVWSHFPDATGEQVLTRVLANLDDRRVTPSRAYGYGVIDPYRAVTATVPDGAANPVYERAGPFLARDTGFGPTGIGSAPQAAGQRGDPPGDYAISPSPRLLTSQVLTGVALAAAGLALLVLLSVFGLRGRRRRLLLARVQLPRWDRLRSNSPVTPDVQVAADGAALAPVGATAAAVSIDTMTAPVLDVARPRPRPGPGPPPLV